MKFSINQKELENILNTVSKGVQTNTTMPALAGVYIDAQENEITVQTTNLEMSIQVNSPALIEEDGKALLPAKLLSDIIKTLPDEAVSIESQDDGVEIVCGKSNFKIRDLNANDFPAFPQVETKQSVEVPFKEFSSITKKVAKMVSKDETRAIITGVLVSVKEGILNMVATDAYRVAVASAKTNVDTKEEFSAVIAGSFLMDIAYLPGDIKTIKIAMSDNQVVITCGDAVFVNRRIEGNFPAYQQLIPEEYTTKIKMDKNLLANAVRRISVLSKTAPVVKFELDPASGVVVLSGNAIDIGSGSESVACKYAEDSSQEPLEISFNCNYVAEGLNCADSKEITLEVQESVRPGIFRDDSENKLIYILLPVKIS